MAAAGLLGPTLAAVTLDYRRAIAALLATRWALFDQLLAASWVRGTRSARLDPGFALRHRAPRQEIAAIGCRVPWRTRRDMSIGTRPTCRARRRLHGATASGADTGRSRLRCSSACGPGRALPHREGGNRRNGSLRNGCASRPARDQNDERHDVERCTTSGVPLVQGVSAISLCALAELLPPRGRSFRRTIGSACQSVAAGGQKAPRRGPFRFAGETAVIRSTSASRHRAAATLRLRYIRAILHRAAGSPTSDLSVVST